MLTRGQLTCSYNWLMFAQLVTLLGERSFILRVPQFFEFLCYSCTTTQKSIQGYDIKDT